MPETWKVFPLHDITMRCLGVSILKNNDHTLTITPRFAIHNYLVRQCNNINTKCWKVTCPPWRMSVPGFADNMSSGGSTVLYYCFSSTFVSSTSLYSFDLSNNSNSWTWAQLCDVFPTSAICRHSVDYKVGKVFHNITVAFNYCINVYDQIITTMSTIIGQNFKIFQERH